MGEFGCHFLIMSLNMAVLLDHIAHSHCRQAAATVVAALPPPLPPCCCHHQAAATITAAALLPPLLPRFRLRRRRAAAKLLLLPPLPSFLSTLLSQLSSLFPMPLPLMLLVDC
jgi:hypothetical protein